MLKFNKDNDFKFTLQPKVGDELIDLSIMEDVKLVIKNEYMKSGFVPIWTITQNGIEVEVQKEMIPNIGIYFGVLSYRRPDGTYVDYFQDKAQGAALFEIVPLTEQAVNDEDPVVLPTSPNYKGDPFTYDDFTEEQILELKRPAIEAADLANQSAVLANSAAEDAEQKADYANANGSYAKEQGDYAKDQGDYAKSKTEEMLALPLLKSTTYSDVEYEI